MGWLDRFKKADFWFGENSLYDQIMPDNMNVTLPGGVGFGVEKKSVGDTVINNVSSTQTGFDIQEFINDPMVKKYAPYVAAYLILKR
jgi:hypothetical protein